MTAPTQADHEVTHTWRRSLGLLWAGQIVSHLGDALFLGVIFLLALDVTGSSAIAGLLIALNFMPALALGLFSGAIVDRYDRRHVMIAADLLRGLAVSAIPILHHFHRLGAVPLGIAVFALATGTTLFNPAIKALIPELAPSRSLTSATSAFQIVDYGALVAGPVVGALLQPLVGSVHLLSIDAVTFFFSAACVACLPRTTATLRPLSMRGSTEALRDPAASLRAITREVLTGMRAVLDVPVLRALLLVVALDNLAMMGLAHVATPLLVKETLGLGASAYLEAQSFFFLGMVVASAGFWWQGRKLPEGPTILVGVILDGLTFLPFALCRTLNQVKLALFIHALAIPLIIIPRTVLVQRNIPGALHGRAFSLINVSVFGMMAISSAVTGILAAHVRPQALFLVLGLAGLVPGLVGFASPTLRRAR